jgi:GT2 family glycosyltransferase
MSQISVLTVVYAKDAEGSATLRSLRALPAELRGRMALHVRDNSAVTSLDPGDLRRWGFAAAALWHDGENRPLGAVYRRFAAEAAGPIVLFLDDDTEVPAAYVEEAVAALTSAGGAGLVCMPRVLDGRGRLFSPSKFGIFAGRHFASLEPGRHHGLNAIMSGLATTRSWLDRLGPSAFSVRSPLYGVDTMFMLAHARAGGATHVCDAVVRHALSREARAGMRDALRRSWLEARGVAWTTLTYRPAWVPLLPAYLSWFMVRRALEALRRPTA